MEGLVFGILRYILTMIKLLTAVTYSCTGSLINQESLLLRKDLFVTDK